jgi:hypothetical protein
VRTRGEFEQDMIRKAAARRSKDGQTPQHPAAAAGLEDGDQDGCDHDHVPAATKAFRDAYEPPAEYPQPIVVHPEDFRKGPLRAGHDAVSPGYEPPLSFRAPPEPRPGPGGWSLAGTRPPGPYLDGVA